MTLKMYWTLEFVRRPSGRPGVSQRQISCMKPWRKMTEIKRQLRIYYDFVIPFKMALISSCPNTWTWAWHSFIQIILDLPEFVEIHPLHTYHAKSAKFQDKGLYTWKKITRIPGWLLCCDQHKMPSLFSHFIQLYLLTLHAFFSISGTSFDVRLYVYQ